MSDANAAPQTMSAISASEVQTLNSSGILYQFFVTCVCITIAIALWLALKKGISAICRRMAISELESLIIKISCWVYWLLALVVILQQAGLNTENLWTTLTAAAAMVAIGFIAVWSVLSNFVSSFLIFSTRLFKPHDEIEILDIGGGSVKGRVRSIDLMFTTLEESPVHGDPSFIKIPNNTFFQKILRVSGATAIKMAHTQHRHDNDSIDTPLVRSVTSESTREIGVPL